MEQVTEFLQVKAALYAPKLVLSLAILAGFWIGAKIAQSIVVRLGRRAHRHADVVGLLGRIVGTSLTTLGVVTALGTAGVNVSALVAGLGLTGFALGFALKDIISNVIAGVLILLYRPFSRNDRVSVAGFEGTVTQIDLRYTTLETESKRFLIPNSTLFTNPISIALPPKGVGGA